MKDLARDARKLEADVATLKQRTFTGADLLVVTDYLGVGVGATMAAVARLDRVRSRQPTEADYDDPPLA